MIPNDDATAVNDITIILHLGIAGTSDSGLVTTKDILVNHRVPLGEPAEPQRLESVLQITEVTLLIMILFNVVYMYRAYQHFCFLLWFAGVMSSFLVARLMHLYK